MNKPRHRYTEKSTVNSRQLALRILTDFDRDPGNLDRIIDKGLANVHLDHRDRRFVFEMVYGVIRRRMTLDHAMDQYVTEKIKDDTLKRILRIGIYQLIYMQKVPDHAAVNETVKLTRVDSRTEHFSGIVNAVMRSLINNKKTITLPDPQGTQLSDLSGAFIPDG